MFCRELFGKKPQKLEFGLQPHKIPDCDVVSTQMIFFLKESLVESDTFPNRPPLVHGVAKIGNDIIDFILWNS